LDSSDGLPLYLTYDSITGYYDGILAVRFVDSTGVTFAAPGTLSVAALSGYAVVTTIAQADSTQTCEAACTNVLFPNVWLITVAAPSNSNSGDTSTFQITCGNLTREFSTIVQ
jgi:hypothetical protein